MSFPTSTESYRADTYATLMLFYPRCYLIKRSFSLQATSHVFLHSMCKYNSPKYDSYSKSSLKEIGYLNYHGVLRLLLGRVRQDTKDMKSKI